MTRFRAPDARGWIGLGSFALACAVLGMILYDRALLDNDAFLVIATALIVTGWVNGPLTWAYSATKGGGELAANNAAIVAASAAAPTGNPGDPVHTVEKL